MKTTRFAAVESVELTITNEQVPICHYLRQPQRLVRAIANPKLIQVLGRERFQLRLRPVDFLDLYHFQPMAILSVTAGTDGTVWVRSEESKIVGNDYINNRFALQLRGKLVPGTAESKTVLRGRAELIVDVELPPPLWLMPRGLVETTGNGLLKSVLQRIKQRILTQLVRDYCEWTRDPEMGATKSTAPHPQTT
ncbi:protein of unknown function (DUF1997) [Rubidibacter lacunae KORDI 51-2]|uniref:DUF1997 domain-containing protein n=1 Tax=Rubidibacter lacunae KORDI 51-2 TaxID=582515 RepID=U5DM09_9CHRO|nr:DUF1997 domain-containing protein [Rubidibacter lacunae]ERN42711.1 protein of unknown function (DUF1997) [Rubidibacter lacunae KORDI 51-2]